MDKHMRIMKEKFVELFPGDTEQRAFFAPGRINLIGEHIDYNGGFVFPAAISYGTYAIVRKRQDKIINFASINMESDGIISCHLEELSYSDEHKWANYPKGMVLKLKEKGYSIDYGFDILFYGNIPYGAGLSSSASIEMVTGIMLKKLYQLEITLKDLVLVGQLVENDYIGVNSGIMDQFSVGFGKKGHAILLDCETLDYEYAPVSLKDHVILIIHTNKNRSLSDSKYNERREQCELALKNLQTELDVQNLCQITPEQFEKTKHVIKDKANQLRAKHVIYEHDRTKKAFKFLSDGNLVQFGKLMNESHTSLQKDYEVTGLELDTIVAAAQGDGAVLGARMTGAGFGGCAIAIVEKQAVDQVTERINKAYVEVVGYEATFYVAHLSDGAKELKEVL